MKALSIKQPWAWAICNLPEPYKKDIENRTWHTKFKGDFLVHASKTFDKEGYKRLLDYLESLNYEGHIPEPKEFIKGAIVGISELTNIANNNDIYFLNTKSIWYEGEYGFILEDSKAFENPIPLKGQLNFFNVDNDLVREELEKTVIKLPINNYEFVIGDKVACRPDAFDVITKHSKKRFGHTIFKGTHIIREIKDDLCRFDDMGIGYSWYSKDELILANKINS
jgi:hypothetical protein